MKRIAFSFFLGVLFLTLQTTLLPSLPIRSIRPDIVLILILYLGLTYSPIHGGILSFFLGYLMDLFSGNSFGLYTFSRPLLFYLAQLFKYRVYLEGFLSQFLFVFFFALFEGLLILALLSALNPVPLGNLYPLLWTRYFPQSFLTGLITPLVFFLLRKLLFSFVPPHDIGMRERG
jgi:rod shape-determining protein MreD